MNKTYLVIGLVAAAGVYLYVKSRTTTANNAKAVNVGLTQVAPNAQPSATQQAQNQIIAASANAMTQWITGLTQPSAPTTF